MNEHEALQAALRALYAIDRHAEKAVFKGWDPKNEVEEIHAITGDLIGELARAGFVVERKAKKAEVDV